MNNTTVVIIIITAWAVVATIAMVTASRARTKLRQVLVRTANELITTKAHLARAQEELRRATTRTVPLRDTEGASLGRALRKITGPVKPTSARTPSTSRQDPSTDTLNGMAMGSLIAPGGWSAPDPAPSCDTSSPSVDSGSCGGGE